MTPHDADSPDPKRKGIAPIWHTCVLILIFVFLGVGEMAGSRPAAPPQPLPFYLGAIAFEWILFAYVWWGIRLRKYPLASLISRDRASKYGRDAAVGMAIWVLWYAVESLVALGLAAAGLANRNVQVRALLSDNGSAYRSHSFRDACQQMQIKHRRTRPYTPRTNGKAERFIQTALKEWAYREHWSSSEQRDAQLQPWADFYNHQRPHASLNMQTPNSRLPMVTTS